MRQKMYPRAELARILRQARQERPKLQVVFTNGCFDLMHVGHLRYLWEARKQGDLLVVAINDDESVRRLKGATRPILNASERCQVMAGLACVDYVTTFHEDTPLELLLELRPNVLVKGANYGLDEIVGRKEVEGWGGQVKALTLIEGCSTTNLVGKVLAQRALADKQARPARS
jgi:D-beta-D-heptose 7-phosphate kinase/D-beta-D-heptose 1-phosphate adenosyltransferase